ncbi:hypothetical protein KQX54_008510 [Cotesia glomerata]|uniref:Uncharacterized protein n=1 Tax=Cotesia glomerata TaxID=32391 RepID=A0AAV7HQE1_COTGL|nr:hypothetical protein KQX54_008510 [Cotesia glomerata]
MSFMHSVECNEKFRRICYMLKVLSARRYKIALLFFHKRKRETVRKTENQELERHSVQYGAAEEGKRHCGEGAEEDGKDPGGNVGKPSLIYPSAATIDIRPHRHQAPGPFQERKARRKVLTLATVERETWLVTTIGYGITYIQWLGCKGSKKGGRKENEMKRRDTCVLQREVLRVTEGKRVYEAHQVLIRKLYLILETHMLRYSYTFARYSGILKLRFSLPTGRIQPDETLCQSPNSCMKFRVMWIRYECLEYMYEI